MNAYSTQNKTKSEMKKMKKIYSKDNKQNDTVQNKLNQNKNKPKLE